MSAGSLRTALLAAGALLAAAGCSIPYTTEDLLQANLCTSDSDCPEDSVCASIGDESSCIARSTELTSVVFEVRPALGSGTKVPSVIQPPAWSALTEEQVIDLDLRLPPHVTVNPSQVFLPCAEQPVPAKITFLPVASVAGLLEGQKYEVDSAVASTPAKIPQGVYHVHVQPHTDPELHPACAKAPPIFLPNWDITAKGVTPVAAAPLLLKGTLRLSQKEDFTKWFIEVVEPYRGQTISEIIHPEQNGIALEVPFQVSFDWTARNEFMPVIRLRPPEGSGKPVIHWSLDAVALQGVVDDVIPVKLDVSKIDTQPRPVGGQVLHDSKTVGATVTLRSMSVSKMQLARYETVVETNANGTFESALPPGVYQVIARPHAEGLALGISTWDVAQSKDCYCGKAIQVQSATTLAGSVGTPAGDPASVEVRLTPASPATLPYLGTVSSTDIPPRPASTLTQNGQFKMNVDPGLFDLSLVPQRGSGYPWLVRPNVYVASASTLDATPVVSLEPFQLQNPVVVQGRVLDADRTPLSGATVRAWIAVGDPTDSKLPPSAVQIGEAVANGDGSYVLRLPPSVQ